MSSSDETPLDAAASRARVEAAIERLRRALEPTDADLEAPTASTPELPTANADAEALMDWLRLDMSGRRLGVQAVPYIELAPLGEWAGSRPPPPTVAAAEPRLATDLPGVGGIERKDEYALAELLAAQGEAFLQNAYRALLRREPDAGGVSYFRKALRDGRLSRYEVLGELLKSPEGRATNVKVRGLASALFFRRVLRVPVLGRIVGIARYIFMLPSLARAVEVMSETQATRQDALAFRVEQLAAATESAVREAETHRIEALGRIVEWIQALEAPRRESLRDVGERLAAIRDSDLAMRRWLAAFAENLVAVGATAQAAASRKALSEVGRGLEESLAVLLQVASWIDSDTQATALLAAETKQALLEMDTLRESQARATTRIDELRDRLDSAGLPIPDRILDDFYADFEDRFRGTREDIKGRLETHMPELEEAYRRTGEAPILDVGCGRGELLEVASARGMKCSGADTNPMMVRRCRELGLEVVEKGGLEYLKSLKPESRSAVTAIHVIEHLPFQDVVQIFDEALRVLRPGGVVIFETPNPENLLVAAFTFWYDPTHLRPLPPDIVRYVAEARGFVRAEVRRLHPAAEHEQLPASADPAIRDRLNGLLYGPRDYAIVAYKP